jgi:predicted metal-dependent phosphoesterase TrpH
MPSSRRNRGYRVVGDTPLGCDLVDLHNHSTASYDASNTLEDYERAYARGAFHAVAITDHNTISGATAFKETGRFPVIVGEEVDTADGELIGLFLHSPLTGGKSAVDTAKEIREQGGLVYVQHPFYKLIRRPLSRNALKTLCRSRLIDIVEGINGGPLMWLFDGQARSWSAGNGLLCAAGSDAHHPGDIARCRVALPSGTVTDGDFGPAALMRGLEHAILVDQRRASALTIASRARYAMVLSRRRRRGEAMKPRAPDASV